MKFSLVLATVGRTDEVDRLLDTLSKQIYSNFELIVVDQNDDGRLLPILDKYANRIKVIRVSSERGLSKARNVGLKHVTGDFVAFPDDDCWYEEETLKSVFDLFEANPRLGGVTGTFCNENGQTEGRWPKEETMLSMSNVWRCAISFSIFLRRSVLETVGGFDESLGVGAGTKWGAGEETDILIRSIKSGVAIKYFPKLVLHHPVKVADFSLSSRPRVASYARGAGRVLRKNEYSISYLLGSVGVNAARALVGLMSLKFQRSAHFYCIARNKTLGWLDKA